MKLKDYKLIFIAVGLIGVLVIVTPTVASYIRPPSGEPFSELYLLGPNLMAENYPFNIALCENYSVYVGVSNHMGASQNYVLYIKLLNQTDPLPDEVTGIPSSVQPLYEFRFSIVNGQTWTNLFAFAFSNVDIINNQSTVKNLDINGVNFNVEKTSSWNSTISEFPYRLLFELWILNPQSDSVQYDNRFVDLQLNCSQTT